jgi:hypothetical protein
MWLPFTADISFQISKWRFVYSSHIPQSQHVVVLYAQHVLTKTFIDKSWRDFCGVSETREKEYT